MNDPRTRLCFQPIEWSCLLVFLMVLGSSVDVSAQCASPPGDINGSGLSDVSDTQCVLGVTFGFLTPSDCASVGSSGADLNCDLLVNVEDALLSISYALSAPLDYAVDNNENGCPDACDVPILGPGPEPFCDVKIPVGSTLLSCDDFSLNTMGPWITPLLGTLFLLEEGKLTASSMGGDNVGMAVKSTLEGVSSIEFGLVGLPPGEDGRYLEFQIKGAAENGAQAVLGKWAFTQGNDFVLAGHAGVVTPLETFLFANDSLSFDVLFPATLRAGLGENGGEHYLWIELSKGSSGKFFGPFPCQECGVYDNLVEVVMSSNFQTLSIESLVLYGNSFDFDADGDGISNSDDNCVDTPNPMQLDLDGDVIGDVCDGDTDDDGVDDLVDACPLVDAFLLDADQDGCVDVLDALPSYVATTPLAPPLVDQVTAFVDAAILEYEALGPGPEPFGPGPEPFQPVIEALLGAHTVLVDNALSSLEPGLVLSRSQYIEHLMSQFVPELDPDLDGVPDGVLDNCAGVFNPIQLDRDFDGIGDSCDTSSPLEAKILYPQEAMTVWGNLIVEAGEILWSPDIVNIAFSYDPDASGGALALVQSVPLFSEEVGTDSFRWSTFNLPATSGIDAELSVIFTDEIGNQASRTVLVNVDQKHDTSFQINVDGFSQSPWSLTFDATDVLDLEGEQLTFDWVIDGMQFQDQGSLFEATISDAVDTPPFTVFSFLAKLTVTDPDGIQGTHEKMVHAVFDEAGILAGLTTGDQETGAPYCGCQTISLRATPGEFSNWYPRGVFPLGPLVTAGNTLDYMEALSIPVLVYFEVDATLTPGSDPALCEHVQTVRRTAKLGERIDVKTDFLGGVCPIDGLKMCLDGHEGWNGQETLEKETDILQIVDGHIRWVDSAGTQALPNLVLGRGFSYASRYYATVGGEAGKCQCTWEVNIEVDMNGDVVEADIEKMECSPSLTPSF